MRYLQSRTFLDQVYPDLHPGLWFKDVYQALSETEQEAWLALFTLAFASYPSGQVNFVSERQLADFFNIDEGAFRSATGKAQEFGKISIIEKAVVPYSSTRELSHPERSGQGSKKVQEIALSGKPWARYKSMKFPGFYDYGENSRTTDGTDRFEIEDTLGSVAVIRPHSDDAPDSPEEGEWRGDDAEPKKALVLPDPKNDLTGRPYRHLKYLLERTEEHTLVFPAHVEGPLNHYQLKDLPDATFFYDEAFGALDLEKLNLLEHGLSFWNFASGQEFIRTMYPSWVAVWSWFLDKSKVFYRFVESSTNQ